jgi:hypothetical protein
MHTQTENLNAPTAPFSGTGENGRPQAQATRELTGNDILSRIDMLIMETDYLREGVEALGKIESGGAGDPHSPGDIGTQAKARAIAQVIEQREQTNREMIGLLRRMYDDLSPRVISPQPSRFPEQSKLLERLIDQSAEMSEETLRAFLDKLT